jgi:uncharacterized protein (DUF952 family)
MGAKLVAMAESSVPEHQILHLISSADWAAAQSLGVIAPPSLAEEGFVHCCTEAQLAGVLERYYAGRDDMLALTIDPTALGDADLKWEAPSHPDGSPNTEAEESQRYPHVYGPIPVAAVVSQHPVP